MRQGAQTYLTVACFQVPDADAAVCVACSDVRRGRRSSQPCHLCRGSPFCRYRRNEGSHLQEKGIKRKLRRFSCLHVRSLPADWPLEAAAEQAEYDED